MSTANGVLLVWTISGALISLSLLAFNVLNLLIATRPTLGSISCVDFTDINNLLNSPPKLGGVPERSIKSAKPPYNSEGGVVPKPNGSHGNHPVCAQRYGAILFNGAATPPNLGGEFLLLTDFVQSNSRDSKPRAHAQD